MDTTLRLSFISFVAISSLETVMKPCLLLVSSILTLKTVTVKSNFACPTALSYDDWICEYVDSAKDNFIGNLALQESNKEVC